MVLKVVGLVEGVASLDVAVVEATFDKGSKDEAVILGSGVEVMAGFETLIDTM